MSREKIVHWIVPTPADVLSDSGPVAQLLGEGYESRPEQLKLAGAVAEVMSRRGTLLAEAGTGVGKSFAYLAPAIARCLDHGETVVISTNTIALQEQLVRKDVPLLMRALGLGEIDAELDDPRAEGESALRPALVKGRGNYVSLRRLELTSKRQEKLLPDAASRRSLHVIEDWAGTTKEGSLSSLPQLERPAVWDRVRSDAGNCMGRKCPNHDICFYQRSRRKMERANLLICNHALFFSDLALRSASGGRGFLPRYDHVVIDEAHSAEDVASEHFGLSLGEGRVHHLLGLLYHERTHKGYLPQLSDAFEAWSADENSIMAAVDAVQNARRAAKGFFDALVRWHGGNPGTKRIRGNLPVEDTLGPAFRDLALRLRTLKENTRREADAFELNSYAMRASEIAEQTSTLLAQDIPGCAYWVEVGGGAGGQQPRATLACSPVEVGPLLREHLYPRPTVEGEDPGDSVKPKSVTLTSATLATRSVDEDEPAERAETAFAHVIERLGCLGATTKQLGSPFGFKDQVEVFVDTTMPSPRAYRPAQRGRSLPTDAEGTSSYEDELARRVLGHIEATDGGAFVLFTSFASLYATADRLHDDLLEQGMPMLVHGRSGERATLVERFRADDRSVLLGAASFWQGVDVRGDGLRNVIITRLPFDPPDRPLTEARLERIREKGGDPFMEESLPRAVTRFKQGFGRLIRSATDRGRVAVLDPRLVTKPYGRLFLKALPPGVPVHRIDGAEPSYPEE